MKIDLSTAPSIMEQRAASWASANPPKPMELRPRKKPQVYAKPPAPEVVPEKVRKRPKGSNIDLRPTLDAEFDEEARRIAYKQAMRAFATDLPKPENYARCMPSWAAEALLTAQFHKPSTTWRIHPAYHGRLRELRALGLVNFGKIPMVTGFSLDVRRALIKLMGED